MHITSGANPRAQDCISYSLSPVSNRRHVLASTEGCFGIAPSTLVLKLLPADLWFQFCVYYDSPPLLLPSSASASHWLEHLLLRVAAEPTGSSQCYWALFCGDSGGKCFAGATSNLVFFYLSSGCQISGYSYPIPCSGRQRSGHLNLIFDVLSVVILL